MASLEQLAGRRGAILASLVLLCLGVWATPEEALPQPRFNVLMLTIDTLRADRLGCYGYGKPTSPTLDRAAEEGFLFEYAYAQRGTTWPSLASLQTALYPVSHGVRTNGVRISPSVTTLAEVLRAEGYQCAAFLSNAANQLWEGFDPVWAEQDKDREVTERGLAWLEAHHGEGPFYLWLHYYAPHSDFDPPEPFRGLFVDKAYTGPIDGTRATLFNAMSFSQDLSAEDQAHLNALYDGEVRFADDQCRQALARLDELGHRNDTLVVISSDHGEALGDRKHYFFHHTSIHETVVRIPLIFRLPEVVPAQGRTGRLVESIDIAPTILEVLGVAAPEVFEGDSLTPFFRGQAPYMGPAITELDDKVLSIRTASHRYVLNPLNYHPRLFSEQMRERYGVEGPRSTYEIETEELFASPEDPRELDNLIEGKPLTAAYLRGELAEWQQEYAWELHSGGESRIDPALREELEALGYVD